MQYLPVIGITMGDPAGVGPEIICKSLLKKDIYDQCKPLVVGDARVFEAIVKRLGFPVQIHAIHDVKQARFESGTLDVLDLNNYEGEIVYGKVSSAAGLAAFESIEKLIELAMKKQVDATVTAPINKEAIHMAGKHFSGHTEIYAHYTGTKKYAMLLVHENLRVIHVTTHVSLRQACDLVKKDRILEVIQLLYDACLSFGISYPRIGVAGLNPHSSDNGLFGWEEEKEISPAIEEAKKKGFDVEGPVPSDTLFAKAIGGQYDGCVAMYHDQGHIPFKMTGFKWNETKKRMDVNGVNITLGLPIIRVSVDHGTAFDVAGKGIASEEAMKLSIDYAVKMAMNKDL
ncbi:MAG: 4-hydroxythreonine-4-phosphate dehydrogenase PdxA [Bacteroidales bacterium]|nr:4-hydroxythreonine-4-phosphate dehydrogenase PdxA [Bacteroidales bacterium]